MNQEDIKILNIYAPIRGIPILIKEILRDLKEQTDISMPHSYVIQTKKRRKKKQQQRNFGIK